MYRQVRDSGDLPPEAGFFLIAWLVDLIADEEIGDALCGPDQHLESVRRKFNLHEDTPASETTPPEYRQAMRQLHDAWDEHYAKTLEGLGENEMAQLFRADRGQFDGEYEAGTGFLRVVNSIVDTGAFEYSLAPAITSTDSATANIGLPFSFTITTTNFPVAPK